jgi:hypothetical protein
MPFKPLFPPGEIFNGYTVMARNARCHAPPAHHHVPSTESAETAIWLMPLFKHNLFFFLLSRRAHLATQKRGREFKQIIRNLLLLARMEIC